MGGLVPKVEIVGMSGVIIIGSDETRENGSEQMTPRDCLGPVFFEMFQTVRDGLPVFPFSLERDLGDPTSEVKLVRKVVSHPHHHDSACRFIHRGRRCEIGHDPLA